MGLVQKKKKKKKKKKEEEEERGVLVLPSPEEERVQQEQGERVVLPEELQEKLLARLPITEVFRLRCLCKPWNHILRSPHFFALHSQAAPSETWLVMQNVGHPAKNDIFMFDTASRRWLQPPLPLSGDPGLRWRYTAAASAGSLVCVPATATDGPGRYTTHYFVVNIFTAAVKKLPPLPFEPVCLVRMSLDSVNNNTYRVFLFHDKPGRVAIYDSSTQAWKVGKANTPFPFPPDSFFKVAMVYGQLFAIASGKHPPAYQKFYVYDVHQEKWTNLELLRWPSCELGLWASNGSYVLGCRNGRTVLLAPDFCPAGTCYGFRLWDLQEEEPNNNNNNQQTGKKWVEMAPIPTATQYETPNAERLRLLTFFCSNRYFISMTGSNGEATEYLKPVLYDLTLDRLETLPPLPPYIASAGFVSRLMLEPNLAATP